MCTPVSLRFGAVVAGLAGVLGVACGTQPKAQGDLSTQEANARGKPAPPGVCDIGVLSGCATGVDEQGRAWIGAASPKLTVEEFTDYECLPCRRAHREARSLLAELKDEVRLVHRDYPVDGQCNPAFDRPIHAHACAFAYATICAAEQGKLWQMSDVLVEKLEKTDAAALDVETVATEIGLDAAKFSMCLASPNVRAKLRADLEESASLKLPSMPAFVIRNPQQNEIHIGLLPPEVVREHLGKIGR